jgi:hypothetical protein
MPRRSTAWMAPFPLRCSLGEQSGDPFAILLGSASQLMP